MLSNKPQLARTYDLVNGYQPLTLSLQLYGFCLGRQQRVATIVHAVEPEFIVSVKKPFRVIVIHPLTLRETVYGGN